MLTAELAYLLHGNHMLTDPPQASHSEPSFRCAICCEEKPERLCQEHPIYGFICADGCEIVKEA